MLEIDGRRGEPAKIAVVGLGGGGSNAVNRMISEGLRDVTFWVANTDAQALQNAVCENRLQLGSALTAGLGAGGDPEVGRAAAEEDAQSLQEVLDGYDMVFLTAGMGGGTGTGSSPVVARIARSLGALTVAIVTRPFLFEGSRRAARAEEGIRQLADEVDTLIVIPNDKLLHLVERGANLNAGLRVADEVLFQATRGISDIILGNGLINVDFADVRTVMKNRGGALLGCGIARGPNRAVESAQAAVSSPLLDDLTISGAEAILVNVVGGPGMGFHEVTEAAQYISEQAGKEADVFWGAVIDPNLEEEMRVTLIATGFQRSPAIRKVERPAVAARPEPAAAATAPPMPERTPAPAPAPVPTPAPRSPEPLRAPEIPEPVYAREPLPPLPGLDDPEILPFPDSLEYGGAAGQDDRLSPAAASAEPEPDPSWTPRIVRGRDDERPGATEAAESWIEEPQAEGPAPATDRGPALWRRRPGRRYRMPDRLDDARFDGRNPLDIPTFLRKQMD